MTSKPETASRTLLVCKRADEVQFEIGVVLP